MNVEFIPSLDESGILRIHLIAYNAPPAVTGSDAWKWKNVLPTFIEEPMLYRARIKVNGSCGSARHLHPSTQVKQVRDTFEIDCHSIHECLEIIMENNKYQKTS